MVSGRPVNKFVRLCESLGCEGKGACAVVKKYTYLGKEKLQVFSVSSLTSTAHWYAKRAKRETYQTFVTRVRDS